MSWFLGIKFPDLHARIDEIISEGEVVAVRVTLSATQNESVDWLPAVGVIPPPGKQFELQEYQFWHVKECKIGERSVCFGTLGMFIM
jgi:predicted ester cyclase